MERSDTYSKVDRLKSRKLIEEVFANGGISKAFPIRIHYLYHSQNEDLILSIGVSVPKRLFKRAVDRNRIKRQLREAFRMHKDIATEKIVEKSLAIMIVYSTKEFLPFDKIEKKVGKALNDVN